MSLNRAMRGVSATATEAPTAAIARKRRRGIAARMAWLRGRAFRAAGALVFDGFQIFRELQGQARSFFHVALHRFLIAPQGVAFVDLAQIASFDIEEQLNLPRPESIALD